MTKLLTRAQVENYIRDGFVYPVDVMAADAAQTYLNRLEASEVLQGNPARHWCVALIAGTTSKMSRVQRSTSASRNRPFNSAQTPCSGGVYDEERLRYHGMHA